MPKYKVESKSVTGHCCFSASVTLGGACVCETLDFEDAVKVARALNELDTEPLKMPPQVVHILTMCLDLAEKADPTVKGAAGVARAWIGERYHTSTGKRID